MHTTTFLSDALNDLYRIWTEYDLSDEEFIHVRDQVCRILQCPLYLSDEEIAFLVHIIYQGASR